jgi:hypothetical protein
MSRDHAIELSDIINFQFYLVYKKWVGLEQNNAQLIPYDGYYASLQFHSKKTNSMNILNRGRANFGKL